MKQIDSFGMSTIGKQHLIVFCKSLALTCVALTSGCSNEENNRDDFITNALSPPELGAATTTSNNLAQIPTVTTNAETDVIRTTDLALPVTPLETNSQLSPQPSPIAVAESTETDLTVAETTETETETNSESSPPTSEIQTQNQESTPTDIDNNSGPTDSEKTSSEESVPTDENPDAEATQTTSDAVISITWKVASNNDLGHYIYYAKNSSDEYVLATQRLLTGSELNGEIQHSFDASVDLGLNISDSVCFSISAFNDVGETDRSTSECVTINK